MEIDEKYASAIVRRYVKARGNTDDVFVVRDGEQIKATEIYDFENEKMVDVVN